MTIIEYATDILGLQLSPIQIMILNEYQKAYDGNYKVRVCDGKRNGKQIILKIIDEFEKYNNEKKVVPISAYEQVVWERDVAIDQLKQLGYGLGERIDKLSDKQKIGELEDVVTSLDCQYYSFIDELCQIIFEGENTEIDRKITIDRIKEFVNYNEWLKEEKI